MTRCVIASLFPRFVLVSGVNIRFSFESGLLRNQSEWAPKAFRGGLQFRAPPSSDSPHRCVLCYHLTMQFTFSCPSRHPYCNLERALTAVPLHRSSRNPCHPGRGTTRAPQKTVEGLVGRRRA
ncbi:hypothetical protein FIBSPDRAFT_113745 [Athelia psychrophila]|uniref:Uncharacterized protein n=1 Tax=Athelia psychrophila TaxID=1759441 RepID=A0A166D4T8_9AGAM|nr:hypothetical protein FIBSPDRAFT_113745 [Fibularhizoctonia sp. CBS 109695]